MTDSALKKEDLPHYTYDDYEKWEGKWELIQGIPIALAPAPGLNHQRICRKIVWQLSDLLKDNTQYEVFLPIDWQITEDTVVQPDALVVCGEKMAGKKLQTTPVIIFEVLSPSTSKNDRMLKYRLYEAAGVKYYCIVDPETCSANVFLFHADQYQPIDDFKDGKMSFDIGACEIQFDFHMIFQQ